MTSAVPSKDAIGRSKRLQRSVTSLRHRVGCSTPWCQTPPDSPAALHNKLAAKGGAAVETAVHRLAACAGPLGGPPKTCCSRDDSKCARFASWRAEGGAPVGGRPRVATTRPTEKRGGRSIAPSGDGMTTDHDAPRILVVDDNEALLRVHARARSPAKGFASTRRRTGTLRWRRSGTTRTT